MRKISLRSALFLGAATGAALSVTASALAQENTELVIVTGSRIPNRDFNSDSPISTISADILKSTGALEVTQTLAALPQVVPSLSAGSNNPPSGGQQSIDLRGLGSNRVVVLMDGRRVAPSNADGTVDLQTIPQAMIERIEVISGGASAVYGPDAITGVVNFITKRDFQGVQVDAQYGISERGDDVENSASILVGGNFAGSKGNIVMSYDWAYRKPVYDSERPFASQATSSTSFSPTGSYVSSSGNRVTQAAIDTYFAAHGGAAAGGVPNSNAIGFNTDGTLFNFGGGGVNVYNYKSDPTYPAKLFCADYTTPAHCATYSYNFAPPNLMIIPLKRQNLMANGFYDINSSVEVYMSLKFTNYTSAESLAPSPAPTHPVTSADGGSASSYIVPTTNPFIPAALASLLATRTGDSALPGVGAAEDFLLRTRFLAEGPRLDVLTNDVFQETFGVKGKLPLNLDFDLFGSFGQLDVTETQHGNVSNSAVEALLFGKGSGSCTGYSDLNPFGALKYGPLSLGCISRITKNTTITTFTNIEGHIGGNIIDLPAGPLAFTLGGDYREQTYTFVPDQLLSSGDISGFNASDPVNGAVYDKEVFGELYIPLLKNQPWADSASVTLGARYTKQDHTHNGGAYTYKAEGDWSVVEGITLRGSFEVATRMPNISELLSTTFQDNPILGDPCNFNGPFRTGAHAVQVQALCAAQGAGAANFMQGQSQIGVVGVGNGALSPETADTYTLGVSWQSRITSPWLSSLSASVDYWNIDLHSPIGIDNFDTMYGCFNFDGSNPTYSNTASTCPSFVRSGAFLTLYTSAGNHGKNKLDGFDLAANWQIELADTVDADPMWGALSVNTSWTWLRDYIVQGSTGAVEVNFAGTIGATSPIGLNIDSALPRLKGQLTAMWDFGDFNLSTRIAYVGAMRNSMAILGWTGLPFPPGTVSGVPSTIYMDVFGHWNVSENLTLRAGVNNVTDQQPRVYNPSQQDGTDPATYDVVGRRYFVALEVKF